MAKVVPVSRLPESLQAAYDLSAQANRLFIDRPYPDERIPTVVTTEAHLLDDNTERIIQCWINPSQTQWAPTLRAARQKTHGGGVRYTWPRSDKAGGGKHKSKNSVYWDVFPVTFTFQTGNIKPESYVSLAGASQQVSGSIMSRMAAYVGGERVTEESKVPPGLDDFYLFLNLLNEDPMLSNGRDNWAVVMHNSHVFPSIMLKGWWDEGSVSWPENQEDGWGLQWTAILEVHQTTPRIWDVDGLRQVYGSFR